MNSKRFRIAFSFGGEKRDFVKKVASILAKHFGELAILYDDYHEAEFARDDLAGHLTQLYRNESDLIVAVWCGDYKTKEWCGLEWKTIRGLLKQGKANMIMLARFDLVEPEMLENLAGFVELDTITPDQFATRILERLALNEDKSKDHYTKPTPQLARLNTSIPHNLPSLLPFFGREDELKKIADALDPENRGWGALIDGPGGMGKTSLAVRAAYDASPDDFKKIVFVSLKARELDDGGVRDLSDFILSGLAELLGEVARELGFDDFAKAAEDKRPRLLLGALRGTQILLILDNLESLTKKERDTVFTFVKKLPAGCKAILTARGRIGSGGEDLILEKLSENAALATLAELATRNPLLLQTSEAERLVLYRETAGKPLLLRWTAGQIGRGHCLTFADALTYLRSCPPDSDPLEFIFGDLVEDFSREETSVLCALTYFTLPAKVEHLTSIAEQSEEEVDRALRSLTVRSLAVASDAFTAFTLVPMVADFLRKKKLEVVADTGDRLEKRAYALIVENGYDSYARFRVLDAAWPSVAPALSLLLAGPNDRLQTVCAALPDFLNFTGRWDEWLALSLQAEDIAVTASDFSNAGWRAYDAGRIYRRRNQSVELLLCAKRAESHWLKLPPSPRERAMVLRLRGLGHRLTGNYTIAIEALRKAVELQRQLNRESVEVATAVNSLAEAERLSGNFAEAEVKFREALQIAEVIGNLRGIEEYTGNLANLALDRKDWPTAETFARQALLLAEKVGRKESIAAQNYRLAKALVRQGKNAEALPYAQRAVQIYTPLGSPRFEAACETLKECEETCRPEFDGTLP